MAIGKRIRASVIFIRDKRRGQDTIRARVPSIVKNRFGAHEGDTLVFEEGCAAAVQEAALKGTYFIVRLERAIDSSALALPGPANKQTQSPDSLPPLAEIVRRKLKGED
jgi:hypothetical protein